jgi:hypothetical protein
MEFNSQEWYQEGNGYISMIEQAQYGWLRIYCLMRKEKYLMNIHICNMNEKGNQEKWKRKQKI